MNTMIRKRTQLSVVAVAALAVLAVAAVMLLAGGKPAQADTAALTPGGSDAQQWPQQSDPTPTPTPRHAPPPACSKDPARVVDSGHIALFDVWWNPEELELTNSSCPPTITYVPETPASGLDPLIPARTDRAASNIDIEKTIIHIPNSAKVTLNETAYPKGENEYKALWDADAKEARDTNGDGKPEEGVGDGMVWALPACPPEGTPPSDGLCIAFSAALLDPVDWLTPDGEPNGKIEYRLDHVHQIDIDKQDPRYTLAYDKDGKLLWDSANVRVAVMEVAPGKYERPVWFFTSRGTYELQVHITGNPNRDDVRTDGLKLLSSDKSVSSDMRTYIIHVGAEADLGVTATASPDNPPPGDEVTVTIAASNAGPESVPDASVDVTLPSELTYSSHAPTGATFADSDGDGVWTWKVGSLASKASQTLTIKATVDAGTRGREFAVKAAISGTETVTITEADDDGNKGEVSYDVPVADPVADNDMATAAVTVASKANVDPMFMVMRSVPENSLGGTLVGDPIMVREPNSGDTLTFSLTDEDGEKQSQFTVSSVSGGAQIAVVAGAGLDFETKPTYNLVMAVSDGKDAAGNPDSSIDHTIGVLIKLTDIENDFSATLRISNTSPRVGETVRLDVTLDNPPVAASRLSYFVVESSGGRVTERDGGPSAYQTEGRVKNAPGTYTYYVGFSFWDGSKFTHRVETNSVTVTWSNP